MTKKRELICHYCKEYFDRDSLIQINKSKRACSKCNETLVRESREYKELIEYLCTGLNLKAPTGYMLKTIAQKKELGYSYKDMQWTVYYMACIRKMKLTDSCINLVPSFYQNMCEYKKLIDNARKLKVDFMQSRKIVEHTDTKKPKRINTRLIDISEIN
ncbi:hypothetical protein UT300003_32340 [Clostridium sardiniense]